jgi:hypothetical protein
LLRSLTIYETTSQVSSVVPTFLVTMKIAAASLLFLAYEGAIAFQAPMTKSQSFALNSSPESYSYSYGGNTVRDGNANTNGNVGQGDSGRVVRPQLCCDIILNPLEEVIA